MANKPAKSDSVEISIAAIVAIAIVGVFFFAGRVSSEVLFPHSSAGAVSQWILAAGGIILAVLWVLRRLR
ncbi:hypothetical protein [Streptomyces sp. LaBMicrA B280]|uniref:hypothetical protein n=1 Tax=Streptomyces sp. LaBMicrA B280 TaxID=3391001 RepID=UPI003BA581F4